MSTAIAATNHQFKLASRPTGAATRENFSYGEESVAQPADGGVLVKTLMLSLDPAMRGWMNEGRSYIPPVQIGEVMRAGGVGRVVASKNPAFAVGDVVYGTLGVQEYALVSADEVKRSGLTKIDLKAGTASQWLNVLGMPGMTGYFGLLEVGLAKAGDTVVVSGAAGAVGQTVGQLAKIKGCRVVGIAGGKDKCHWLTSELGFDAAVDYKDGATFKALRAAAPKGIDVYFDNVGGDILEACIAQMNLNGRIACCGAISQYDGVPSAHGPRGVPGLIVVKRLTMQGFIVMDYMDRRDAALADLQSWVASGQLKVQEDVINGIENTPQALIGLLAGENRGKRMVKV